MQIFGPFFGNLGGLKFEEWGFAGKRRWRTSTGMWSSSRWTLRSTRRLRLRCARYAHKRAFLSLHFLVIPSETEKSKGGAVCATPPTVFPTACRDPDIAERARTMPGSCWEIACLTWGSVAARAHRHCSCWRTASWSRRWRGQPPPTRLYGRRSTRPTPRRRTSKRRLLLSSVLWRVAVGRTV